MNLQPVIIVGAARSGTKIIRDTLAAASDVASVPYDINYIWRYGNEHIDHDELSVSMVTPKAERYISDKLSHLAFRNSGHVGKGIVLEKTVSNSLRPAYVKKVLPQAKLVHVVRDGRAVVESAMRSWNRPEGPKYLVEKLRYFPIQNYEYALNYLWNRIKKTARGDKTLALWGPRYDGIREDIEHYDLPYVCSRQWLKSIENSRAFLNTLPQSEYFEIKYEDFITGGNQFRNLVSFVGFEDVASVESYFDENVNITSSDKWAEQLSSKVLGRVESMMSDHLLHYQYS